MRNFPLIKYLIPIFLLTACQQAPQNTANKDFIFQQSAFLMDTLVQVQVVHQNSELAQKAVSAAFARMEAIDKEMSRFSPDSSVSKINQQSGKTALTVSPQLFTLLQRGKNWGKLTNGQFDITIGAISRLWNFEKGYPPQESLLSRALPLVDYRKLVLDKNKSSAYLNQDGMFIDLGGIAKGYAIDEAIRILKENGIQQALVDAGGDMRALGGKTQDQAWNIGLQNPRRHNEIIATIPINNKAIVTSGDYERFFINKGVRYHHIIDPNTGQPARGLISVTVVAPLAETADVLSTAVFVLGSKKGLQLIKEQANCEALLITVAGEIITTANFPGKLKIKKLDLTGI